MNQTPKIWPWVVGVVVILFIVLMYYWSTQSLTPNAVPGQQNQPTQVEPPPQPTEYTPVATSTSATSTPSSKKK